MRQTAVKSQGDRKISPGRKSDANAPLKRVARSHNLTDKQYKHIVRLLGREPTITEVGIFGVMWSEHCSYGSSKKYLKRFPTRGKQVLVSAGKENAGVVDIGGGWFSAFKIESHNHPSAVEPVQGAATGVGGIIRDIFTMGARPIALFDSLRFGTLNGHRRIQYLLNGVVKGIADYGNCVGVPTVGGEIAFDETYRENPLVNVMCIGVLRKRSIAHAAARGAGNSVVYVGSSTGRDGLGGASFASRELTEGSDADRPAVQIGDPFTEKCLIEATLEALRIGDIVGIQDMGAAGLTSSTCETASRGGCGIEIDVLRVPRRAENMSAYEVMLSESQERMLLIVKRGRISRIKRIFSRWGLNAFEIGHVINDSRLRIKEGTTVVADIPVSALTDEAPVYNRPTRRPKYLSRANKLSLQKIHQPNDYTNALKQLLNHPTISNKSSIFEQYDHMVQTNTVALPGRSDAAVLRLKGADCMLAATTDGNGRYCYLDPYEGGKLAVAEAARNLICVGARPLAITDCLNFGNPEDPEIMWQFKECVRGISEACRAFNTPVTGGNVSFYNESPQGAIFPTPVIGMIGVIEGGVGRGAGGKGKTDSRPITANFKDEQDVIILLGETKEELGGSEYLSVIHRLARGRPPRVNLVKERKLQRFMLEATRQDLVKSAHDCSEGGLAVAITECCIMDQANPIGAICDLSFLTSHLSLRADALLFGESAGRVVVSCEPSDADVLLRSAKRRGISASVIGCVGGRRLSINWWIDAFVDELSNAWCRNLIAYVAN